MVQIAMGLNLENPDNTLACHFLKSFKLRREFSFKSVLSMCSINGLYIVYNIKFNILFIHCKKNRRGYERARGEPSLGDVSTVMVNCISLHEKWVKRFKCYCM